MGNDSCLKEDYLIAAYLVGIFLLQIALKLPRTCQSPCPAVSIIFKLHTSLYTKKWKYEEWLNVGVERLFQLLTYRVVVEQDKERGDVSTEGRAGFFFVLFWFWFCLFVCLLIFVVWEGLYMAFTLPKSKQGNIWLHALWYLRVKVLSHPRYLGIPAFLFHTGWLHSSFRSLFKSSTFCMFLLLPGLLHCPISGYNSSSKGLYVLHFIFLLPWPAGFPSLILLPFSITDWIKRFGFTFRRAEIFMLLEDFINLYFER